MPERAREAEVWRLEGVVGRKLHRGLVVSAVEGRVGVEHDESDATLVDVVVYRTDVGPRPLAQALLLVHEAMLAMVNVELSGGVRREVWYAVGKRVLLRGRLRACRQAAFWPEGGRSAVSRARSLSEVSRANSKPLRWCVVFLAGKEKASVSFVRGRVGHLEDEQAGSGRLDSRHERRGIGCSLPL